MIRKIFASILIIYITFMSFSEVFLSINVEATQGDLSKIKQHGNYVFEEIDDITIEKIKQYAKDNDVHITNLSDSELKEAYEQKINAGKQYILSTLGLSINKLEEDLNRNKAELEAFKEAIDNRKKLTRQRPGYISRTASPGGTGHNVAHASTARGSTEAKGDQTGNEVKTGTFMRSAVSRFFRYPDPDVAESLADLMIDMANNNNVGYSQTNERGSYYEELKKNGYDPSLISTPCNTDCSASIAANIIATGHWHNIESFKNFNSGTNTTSFIGGGIQGLGFYEVFVGNDFSVLKRGDFLWRSGHTMIYIGAYEGGAPGIPSAGLNSLRGGAKYEADNEEIATEWDIDKNNDEIDFKFEGLPQSVTKEAKEKPIKNIFEYLGDFIDYMIGLNFTIMKLVIIGFANVIQYLFTTMLRIPTQ